jgi:hypothetical protein
MILSGKIRGPAARRLAPSVFCFLILAAVCGSAQDRGMTLAVREALGGGVEAGKQWAVFIAIDRYQEWGPLSNPVRDAREIRDILKADYYIDEVRELYDREATAGNIRRLFEDLQRQTGRNDSVFVFYAGHGQTDRITKSGSWIPVDGGRDQYAQTNWLPNIHVRNMLAALPARHVFLIADSCFSGDILDTNRGASPEITSEYLRRAYSLVSRQVMTSGASESVPDSSEFAMRLKSALSRANEPCIDPEYIFMNVREVRATQPSLGYIRESEHQQGGSFLFFRRQAAAVPAAMAMTRTAPPNWISRIPPKTERSVYFVGKSDKPENNTSYLEAKSGAVADILSQFAVYKGVRVQSMFTEHTDGKENIYENARKITAGNIDSAGLYQQAEWLGNDGTLYALYTYPVGNGERNAVPKPDLPEFFSHVALRNDRIYFTAHASSRNNNVEELSGQAEQDAKMQVLFWLGGTIAYTDEEYVMESNDSITTEAFKAAVRFTSQINTQNIAFREEANYKQREDDLRYHYYGLYSISGNAGTSGRIQEYGYFNYFVEKDSGGNIEKNINFNGTMYAYDKPAGISLHNVSAGETPDFINAPSPDDCLWGIGIANTASLEIKNFMAQGRALQSLSSQVHSTGQAMSSAHEASAKALSDNTLHSAVKIKDEVTGDNTSWHLWELSKEDTTGMVPNYRD